MSSPETALKHEPGKPHANRSRHFATKCSEANEVEKSPEIQQSATSKCCLPYCGSNYIQTVLHNKPEQKNMPCPPRKAPSNPLQIRACENYQNMKNTPTPLRKSCSNLPPASISTTHNPWNLCNSLKIRDTEKPFKSSPKTAIKRMPGKASPFPLIK